MASSSGSPCAACKFLRRKCMPECVFAPYFPPDQPQKFANVHKIFGASNVAKLLNELPPQQREDAVNSLAYEADARVKDPVYGCVGAISMLQRQIAQLQQELSIAHADLARLTAGGAAPVAGLIGGPPISTLNQSQIAGASSSGMGMGHPTPISMQPPTREQMLAREQMILARDQQSRLMTTNHLLEQLERETQLTREQLIEQLTRAGGGSLEAGLAALGLAAGSMQTAHVGQMGYLPLPPNEGGGGGSGGGVGQS